MAPKKVNLQWIANRSSRRAAYKRRCKGLMKKAGELATLCGVKACVVVYGEGEAQPEVWPAVAEARRVLKKFKDTPEVGGFKKTKNQECFLNDRFFKLNGQVSRSDHENSERETSILLHDSMFGRRPGLVGTTVNELVSLSSMVEDKMNRAKERLQQIVVAVGQGALPEPPPLGLQPASLSSSQMQASYTFTKMQTLAPAEEPQPLLADDLAANGGEELGGAFCGAFAGSSSTGPSGFGRDMMQPCNLGSCSGFPWAWE